MADQFTQGKTNLVEPPFGSYVDQWWSPVNSNFGVTDAAVSGTTTINVTTIPVSAPFVTLVFTNFDAVTNPTPWTNPLAGQNLRIVLTGSLSFNVTVYIPSNRPGFWIFDNQTGGAFTVTVQTDATGSVGVTVAQGYMTILFSDGTNVNYADLGNIISHQAAQTVFPGAIMAYAMVAAPAGWLVCNGAAVSRTGYAALFSAIGTAWGVGDGSTTFNVPNLNGQFLRGWDSGGTVDPNRTFASKQADAVGPLTVTDPGHVHTISAYDSDHTAGNGDWSHQAGPNYTPSTNSAKTGITVVGTNTAPETRPVNVAVQYCIKT